MFEEAGDVFRSQLDKTSRPGAGASGWVLPQFETEFGATIRDVEMAYETHGVLSLSGDNVVWLCHALTGDAHVADGDGRPGWWGALIGSGKAIDTDRFFVVSANVLGGCSGTTGPASAAPGGEWAYGSTFPEVTIRDMVAAQKVLADHLGVRRILAVMGGSMGGMQALEWAVMYPELVGKAVVIAADPQFSAMGIAYNDVMRQAILTDSHYHGGDYLRYGEFPEQGLRVARMLGMISYRTATLFQERFGREVLDGEFQINRYLRYQGDKLVRRFDAQSYLALLRAMDTHDIGRDRDGLASAFARIRAELVWVGIDDDLLYSPATLRQAVEFATSCGVNARYEHIASVFGHDAFLIEFEQLRHILQVILQMP